MNKQRTCYAIQRLTPTYLGGCHGNEYLLAIHHEWTHHSKRDRHEADHILAVPPMDLIVVIFEPPCARDLVEGDAGPPLVELPPQTYCVVAAHLVFELGEWIIQSRGKRFILGVYIQYDTIYV